MKLMVIWGSSRQGRKGGPVAEWVRRRAKADGRFEVDFVDPRELKLPFFDEPLSPFSMAREGQAYSHPEGKEWAERVAAADGYLIVTPEYNRSPSAVLKNALDWVGPEWVDKPVAFVSYGGASGGVYAVGALRNITIELGLVQVANPIHLSRFSDAFDEQGEPKFPRNDELLKEMLDELLRLSNVFKAAKTTNQT